MNWREEYRRKILSPEEAVRVVQSGDRVMVPLGADPQILTKALFNRKDELKGVEITANAAGSNPGWYSDGRFPHCCNCTRDRVRGRFLDPDEG